MEFLRGGRCQGGRPVVHRGAGGIALQRGHCVATRALRCNERIALQRSYCVATRALRCNERIALQRAHCVATNGEASQEGRAASHCRAKWPQSAERFSSQILAPLRPRAFQDPEHPRNLASQSGHADLPRPLRTPARRVSPPGGHPPSNPPSFATVFETLSNADSHLETDPIYG
jgi:hypothetical protein